MRNYGVVLSIFFSHQDYINLSDSAHRLISFLAASDSGNLIGCFRLTQSIMKDSLNWDEEKCFSIIEELENFGFIKYDRHSKWVIICNYLLPEWQPIQNFNQGECARKLFEKIPKNFLFMEDLANAILLHEKKLPHEFANKLRAIVGKDELTEDETKKPKKETVSKRLRNPSETVSKGFEKGSETVSKPVTVTVTVNSKQYRDLNTTQEQTSCSAYEQPLPLEAPIVFIPLRGGIEFPITQSFINEMKLFYPEVDVVHELRECRIWNIANPRQRKPKERALEHLRHWLTNAQKKANGLVPAKTKANAPSSSLRSTCNENLEVGKKWLKSTPSDVPCDAKERFVVLMCAIAAQYNQRKLEKETFQLYWKDLNKFKSEVIEDAFRVHSATPGQGKFMPQPAELLEIINAKAEAVAKEKVSKFFSKANEFIDSENEKYQRQLFDKFRAKLHDKKQVEEFLMQKGKRITPDFSNFQIDDELIASFAFHESVPRLLKKRPDEIVKKYSAHLVSSSVAIAAC